MPNLENRIRSRAYELWQRAGCPDGRSWEFWFAARREIEGEKAKVATPVDPFAPPIDEPPEVKFQHGVPVGMPGERIAEQGVADDRLADLITVPGRRKDK